MNPGYLKCRYSGFVLSLPLCASNDNFKEFRDVVGPGIQSGVKTLLDGGEDNTGFDSIIDSLIDGLFAIVDPNTANSS